MEEKSRKKVFVLVSMVLLVLLVAASIGVAIFVATNPMDKAVDVTGLAFVCAVFIAAITLAGVFAVETRPLIIVAAITLIMGLVAFWTEGHNWGVLLTLGLLCIISVFISLITICLGGIRSSKTPPLNQLLNGD